MRQTGVIGKCMSDDPVDDCDDVDISVSSSQPPSKRKQRRYRTTFTSYQLEEYRTGLLQDTLSRRIHKVYKNDFTSSLMELN